MRVILRISEFCATLICTFEAAGERRRRSPSIEKNSVRSTSEWNSHIARVAHQKTRHTFYTEKQGVFCIFHSCANRGAQCNTFNKRFLKPPSRAARTSKKNFGDFGFFCDLKRRRASNLRENASHVVDALARDALATGRVIEHFH